MSNHNTPDPNSRVHGFSLRDSLIHQCPSMTEDHIRIHMDFINKTMISVPHLDISRYRIDPENPGAINMG